jgi:hypothetical protein
LREERFDCRDVESLSEKIYLIFHKDLIINVESL